MNKSAGGQCYHTVKLTYLCNVQENCKNVKQFRLYSVQLKAQQVYCVCQTVQCAVMLSCWKHAQQRKEHSVICVLVSEDNASAHVLQHSNVHVHVCSRCTSGVGSGKDKILFICEVFVYCQTCESGPDTDGPLLLQW